MSTRVQAHVPQPAGPESKSLRAHGTSLARPGGAVLSLQRAAGNSATAALIQRQCTSCRDEEKLQRQAEDEDPRDAAIQRKCACGGSCASCRGGGDETERILRDELDSPGSPLDPQTQSEMERGFGEGFSDVRIHTGGHAARAAAAINAQAWTSGTDVVFGGGRYAPRTVGGRALLAHELSHVLQQRDTQSAGSHLQSGEVADTGLAIQPKLSISQPDDPFERQADEIAEQVVETLAQPSEESIGGGTAPAVQRACDECKINPPEAEDVEEEKEEAEAEGAGVQRKADRTAPVEAQSPSPAARLQEGLNTSRNEGRPLPTRVRQQMETGFGRDFSRVRIHTGAEAAGMSRLIHAKAFTHGHSIYFNQGRFSPETASGRLLLAHELTHVVQQMGNRGIHPKIQRAAELKIGNWAHARIQEKLRGRDKSLITEAPIPGATRDDRKHNSVGFADFYKSQGGVVSGISAQEPEESKNQPGKAPFYEYVRLKENWRQRATSGNKIQFGPDKTGKKWDFTHTLPSRFEIAELKPLFPLEFPASLAYFGRGWDQAGNYRIGFAEFIRKAHQDLPQHASKLPLSATGVPLNLDSIIPNALNYSMFEQEHGEPPGTDAILKKDTQERLWMFRLDGGVYVYFLVPQKYKSKEYPKKVDSQLQKLDPLLRELRQARPNMSGTFPKREVGAPPAAEADAPQGVAPEIQAKAEDWKRRATTWETHRRNWAKGTGSGVERPKKFLKEEAKGVEKKAKVDEKLKRTPSAAFAQDAKNVRSIRFWSGLRGRALGYLRFRFGHVFDKVEALFEKMRTKLREHHGKAAGLNAKGGIFGGWKKKATQVIIRLAVDVLREMVVYAFKGFVGCMNGIIEAITGEYKSAVDEAKGELAEKIEPMCCGVVDFHEKLDEEYKKHEAEIATFTGAIETINEWRDILTAVEVAVRVGVQIVSCGAPPALGCLWGLVAQLAIETGLSLLMETDYFEDEIAKPAAHGLMDAIVGDSFHNFLIGVLEDTPLGPYLGKAAACRRRVSVRGGSRQIGGNPDKLDPNDPKIVKIREAWEKKHEKQILQDLQSVFEKEGGKKPVTKEELEKLVEELRNFKGTAEEFRTMLTSTRNPSSGRMDIDKARETVKKGEVVPKPGQGEKKERRIDYEKAIRSNVSYEKILGFSPARITSTPGMKADSAEFANAVYDMQDAMKLPKPDGICGPDTVKAWYEKNKIKKDAVYAGAVKVLENAKAEKEAQERGEGAEQAPAPSFNTLSGADFAIKDQNKPQNIPKGTRIYLYDPRYTDIVRVPKPGDRELIKAPEFVTIDIYHEGQHLNRVVNVAVVMKIWKTIASIGGASGIWELEMTLKDGLDISPLVYPDQNLVIRSWRWSLDGMEEKAKAGTPEAKVP